MEFNLGLASFAASDPSVVFRGLSIATTAQDPYSP